MSEALKPYSFRFGYDPSTKVGDVSALALMNDGETQFIYGETADYIHRLLTATPTLPDEEEATRLFNHIKHGDKEHQSWLRNELEKFFGVKINA